MWIIIILIVVIAVVLVTKKSHQQQASTDKQAWTGTEYIIADKGEDIIRHAPQPDINLGFANMPEYIVSGKKKTTNRKNTRYIRCKDELTAKEYAINTEGLMEPLIVSIAEFRPARELENGLSVPAGASYWDSDMFEWSVLAKDTEHIPPEFMAYLTDLGIPMSWLGGRNCAADAVFKHCNLRENLPFMHMQFTVPYRGAFQAI